MKMTKPKKICEEIINLILKSDSRIIKELNCSKLALMYDINRSYLSKIFKQSRGIYLKEYLKRIKLLNSALLMFKRRDLTVKQIAGKSGFENVCHFTKSFEEFYGITPGKFKKMIV